MRWHRTQIQLTAAQREALRRIEYEESKSLAEIIRQAVDEYLERRKEGRSHG